MTAGELLFATELLQDNPNVCKIERRSNFIPEHNDEWIDFLHVELQDGTHVELYTMNDVFAILCMTG